MIPIQINLDYQKIGQRIKAARLEMGLNQSQLGEMIGCSNNHMSHVEVGQTKVSLAMLIKLSAILNKDFEYFLMDTPYVKAQTIINTEIAEKMQQCTPATLITMNKILDALLEQQHRTAGNKSQI